MPVKFRGDWLTARDTSPGKWTMGRNGGLRGVPWRGLLAAATVALALTVGLALPVQAATRFVATTGNDSSNTCLSSSSPCKTITRALSQAVANDTISVAAGIYNTALGETFPLFITKILTLTGAGAGSTIIDATGANTRVILVNFVTATITGVTITGGAASCTASGSGSCETEGGGLFNEGTLTLTNSTVSGNTVSCTNSGSGQCGAVGGGLFNFFLGTLTLTNSTVSGNTATCTASGSGPSFPCFASGGGLYSDHDVTLTLTASTVSGNTATCTNSGSGSCSARGGGLTNNEGTLTLTNSTVSGNTVSCTASGSGHCATEGGGLWLEGTLTLTNSTVSGNTASCSGAACNASGGGLLLPFDTLTLTNSTVSGNTASCSGTGCGAAGGGLTNRSDATLTLTNSTVSGNTASCSGTGCGAAGGGLINVSGTVTLQNTIVAKQLAGPDCAGTITSNGFNLASDNTCQLTQPSDKPNVSTPLLGPLQNNGGPTRTHALLPGSLAINAGTNIDCPSADQRGIARPQGATCDIGAFEFGVIVAAVELNGASFHTGQQISYQATLNPGFTPTQVDMYLGCLLPDGATILSLVQTSPGVISIALGSSPIPFLTNQTLGPLAVQFDFTFTGAEPAGTYFTYAGLAVAGSNPFVPANQLSLGVQPFQFAP